MKHGGPSTRDNAVALCKEPCHRYFDRLALREGIYYDEVVMWPGEGLRKVAGKRMGSENLDTESTLKAYEEKVARNLEAYSESTDSVAALHRMTHQLLTHLFAGDIEGVNASVNLLEAQLPDFHRKHERLLQTSSDLFDIYKLGMPQLMPELSKLRAALVTLAKSEGKALEPLRGLAESPVVSNQHPMGAKVAEVFRKLLQEWEFVSSRIVAIVNVFDERIVLAKSTEEDGRSVDEGSLDWRQYVHTDPDILYGKPVVKGTRLAVEFLLDLFAGGWTEEEVLEEYPSLTREGLRAVFTYASDRIAEDSLTLSHS